MSQGSHNKSKIARRAGGSIEDRIRAARERREGRDVVPEDEPDQDFEDQSPTVSEFTSEAPLPIPRKGRPLLLGTLLILLAASLGATAWLTTSGPSLSDEPPFASSVAPSLSSVAEEAELSFPWTVAGESRVSVSTRSPFMPSAFPVSDPEIFVDPPVRETRPPTAAAPSDTARPIARP